MHGKAGKHRTWTINCIIAIKSRALCEAQNQSSETASCGRKCEMQCVLLKWTWRADEAADSFFGGGCPEFILLPVSLVYQNLSEMEYPSSFHITLCVLYKAKNKSCHWKFSGSKAV
jgi:hypothetical protein